MFQIILYNDNKNTFAHVMKTLIQLCGHSPDQAEQCAMLVHYKGQCSIKHCKTYLEMEKLNDELGAQGLTTNWTTIDV